MPHIKSPRSQRAFTLIEAMTASAILCFCVVALASAMTAATEQSIATAAKSSALQSTTAGMELLAAHPMTDLYVSSGGTTQSLASSVFPTTEGITTNGQLQFINRSTKQGANDLAIVSVTSTSDQGPVVTLYRLVSKEGNGQ